MVSGSNFDDLIARTQSLVSRAQEQVSYARTLREIANDLRYENAIFREFLSEKRIALLSRYAKSPQ